MKKEDVNGEVLLGLGEDHLRELGFSHSAITLGSWPVFEVLHEPPWRSQVK